MIIVNDALLCHSLDGKPEREWQLLDDHLEATADLAEKFASSFAPGWGRLAGLWHDAGKYQKAFQRYIASDSDAHIKGAPFGSPCCQDRRC
jgi:hypothetical protein